MVASATSKTIFTLNPGTWDPSTCMTLSYCIHLPLIPLQLSYPLRIKFLLLFLDTRDAAQLYRFAQTANFVDDEQESNRNTSSMFDEKVDRK